ncbi:MAG TPA: HAD hydrolase-like protein [Caulobacteraceae bacterium]|nr:HAD hydrolase-like protein [Caulobacteraceae bacterium]
MDASKSWDEELRTPAGYMFDVDGTLVLGDRSGQGYQVLPGAKEVLETLKAKGIPFVLLTNGSAYPAAVQAPRLRAVGLPVEDWQMLTPSSVTADYLARKGVKRALILGTPGVGHPLAEKGIELVFTGQPGAEEADAVYVGWHPDCGMRDIEAACRAIWNGAGLYIASSVPFFASHGGKAIGYSHAIYAAIRSLTGGKRGIITGKPSQHALKFVARTLGVPLRDVGVVGDDPTLEPAMARKGGAIGFGVTTGIYKQDDWLAQPPANRPVRLLSCVGDLMKLGVIG